MQSVPRAGHRRHACARRAVMSSTLATLADATRDLTLTICQVGPSCRRGKELRFLTGETGGAKRSRSGAGA